MFIKATKTVNLSGSYGGIFWRTDTGEICLVEQFGRTGESGRRVYLLTEEYTEEFSFSLDFGTYVLEKERQVHAAYFWSGQIGICVDKMGLQSGWKKNITRLYWFYGNGNAGPGYNELYNPIKAFAVRHEEAVRVFWIQDPQEGNLVRWGSGDSQPPTTTKQYLPWRTVKGNIRGMDFWEPEETEDPFDYLIVACENGMFYWMDVSRWLGPTKLTTLEMNEYKFFGGMEAKNITDIALDRENNILYILDSNNRVLIYMIEPFGDEEEDYDNTPRAVRLYCDVDECAPGDEIIVYGMFYDMWNQPIETEGNPMDFIAGGGLGKFQDPETLEWKISVRVFTGETGVASVTYKADEVEDDET